MACIELILFKITQLEIPCKSWFLCSAFIMALAATWLTSDCGSTRLNKTKKAGGQEEIESIRIRWLWPCLELVIIGFVAAKNKKIPLNSSRYQWFYSPCKTHPPWDWTSSPILGTAALLQHRAERVSKQGLWSKVIVLHLEACAWPRAGQL